MTGVTGYESGVSTQPRTTSPNRHRRIHSLCNLGRSLTLDPIMAVVAEVICVGYVLTGYAFWGNYQVKTSSPLVSRNPTAAERCKWFGVHVACLITNPFTPLITLLISLYGLIVSPSQAHSALTKLSNSSLLLSACYGN